MHRFLYYSKAPQRREFPAYVAALTAGSFV